VLRRVAVELRRLPIDKVGVVALIDRSEYVDVEYVVVDGHLAERPVTMADIPAWEPVGEGPHSLAAKVEFCRQRVADGAALLAAYEGDELSASPSSILDSMGSWHGLRSSTSVARTDGAVWRRRCGTRPLISLSQ